MGELTIRHLEESLELSGKMLDLAERGVEGCQDDGCLVVYGIIRDHKGSIKVESTVGQGTVFIVRLPAVKSED